MCAASPSRNARPLRKLLRHPVMHVIGGEPVDPLRRHLEVARSRGRSRPQTQLLRGSARSSRTVPIRRARPRRPAGTPPGSPPRRGRCAVPRRTRAAAVDVGDIEHLPVGAAGEAGAQRLAHERARPVAAGEVGRLAGFLRPSGPRSRARMRRPVVAEAVQLRPALDRHAERRQPLEQQPLVLVLRKDLQKRVGREPAPIASNARALRARPDP